MTSLLLRIVTLLLLVLCCPWLGASVNGQALKFFFPNFVPDSLNSHVGLQTIGSSFVLYGQLQLTPDNEMDPAPMAVGKAFYAQRIRMLDPVTSQAASFSTFFTFSINNLSCSRQLCGDGLAFLISPDNHALGEYGGNLGIYNSSDAGGPRQSLANTLAVEFDTYMNLNPIYDIDDNHVGINLENATSKVAVSASTVNVNLKDGSEITAWIDYESLNQSLQVRIGYNASNRPEKALVDYTVNLTDIFNEFVYVGFAAATGNYYELHTVYSWNFVSHAREPDTPPTPATDPFPDPWSSPDGKPFPHGSPDSSTSDSGPSSSAPLSHVLTGLIVGLPIGVAIIILVCAFFLLGKRRNLWVLRRSKTRESAEPTLHGPENFRYKQLSVATKGFSDTEKLGDARSNFYRGVLASSGVLVAVKRIRDVHSKYDKDVLAELSIFTQLGHQNLVQLLGWCKDRGKYILVYEFMPQGNLTRALYGDVGGEILTWSQRFNIVLGVAESLNYLHGGYRQQVMHRNVKSSNVMLDENFNARLGDFGLIEEHSRDVRSQTYDSFGYEAPETFPTGKGSIKADVFSFGAVALEIACGRRPIEGAFPSEEVFLVDWVWGLHSQGSIASAVDRRLGGNFVAAQLQATLLVGLLCSQPDPASRPSMRQVLKYLSGDTPIPHANQPVPSFRQSVDVRNTATSNPFTRQKI